MREEMARRDEDQDNKQTGGTLQHHHHHHHPPAGHTDSKGGEALRAALADYRALFQNRNFLFLASGFGLGLGVFNALLTLIAQFLAPCNYDEDAAGFAGGALLLAGLIAAGVAGAVLDKTRALVPMLHVLIALCVASTIFVLASLRKGAEEVMIAAFAVLGATLIPLLPVSLENAAECTYPVREDSSASLLLGIGQIVGIAAIFALQALLNTDSAQSCESVATPSAGLFLALMVAAGICIACFRKDYRRRRQAEAVEEAEERGGSAAVAAAAAAAATAGPGYQSPGPTV
jgi:FLVCR family MFS transporter 7